MIITCEIDEFQNFLTLSLTVRMDQQRKVVIAELLFVVQNKHGTIPSLNLQSILVGFYNEEEVKACKAILYEFAHSVYDEKEIGRCVKRQGDDRKKLDVADIVQLYELLDQKKVIFPIFTAANMSRIPGIKPLEGDILALSASVNELKSQMHSLTASFGMLQSKVAGNVDTTKASGSKDFFPELSGKSLTVNLDQNMAAASNDRSNLRVNSSISSKTLAIQPGQRIRDETTANSSSDYDNRSTWTQVGRNGKPIRDASGNSSGIHSSQPLYGVKDAGGSKVRAVTEERTWHCKIGRLCSDVKDSDIVDYLKDHGVKPLNVERLHSKQGSPISMHIEVPFEFKDRVMSSEFWSKGIRVSGWRFRYNSRRSRDSYSDFRWDMDY